MSRIHRRRDTKERFLRVSAELFRRQGYNGTGLKEITARASAPLGSLYHFFPGGKENLAAEAVSRAGERYENLIAKVLHEANGPAEAVKRFFDYAIIALERSEFADGCPIGTVALDVASSNEAVRQACATVLKRWQALLIEQLERAGHPGDRARHLGVFAIAALEGAILLARAQRDPEPLRVTGAIVYDGLLISQ